MCLFCTIGESDGVAEEQDGSGNGNVSTLEKEEEENDLSLEIFVKEIDEFCGGLESFVSSVGGDQGMLY